MLFMLKYSGRLFIGGAIIYFVKRIIHNNTQ